MASVPIFAVMASGGLAAALAVGDLDGKVEALAEVSRTGVLGDVARGEDVCACLADPDLLVRAAATRALGSARADAVLLASTVAELLATGDAGAKCAAAAVLGSLEDGASQYAQPLAELLSLSGESNAAIAALSCVLDRPTPSQRNPRCAAMEALPKLGEAGCAFGAAVAELLADEAAEVRSTAAASLGAMGMEGSMHEDDVLKALNGEKDPQVVAALAMSLGAMARSSGVPAPESLRAVARLLAAHSPAVRAGAARALGGMAEQTVQYVPKLVKCLKDRCPQVKIAVIGALVELGEAGQVYATDVARLAEDEWQLPCVRVAAIDGLAGMGDRGLAFEEDIGQLAGDASWEVQEAVHRFFQKAGAGAGEDVWH